MNRSTYWAWIVVVFLVLFVTADSGYKNSIGFANIALLIIGWNRMEDTIHSNWWSIFVLSGFGLIIIGCLQSASQIKKRELANFKNNML